MQYKKLFAALAGAGLTMASTTAAAAINWFNPLTTFEDDDTTWVQDSTGAFKTSGTLVTGDILTSVFEIPFTRPAGGANGPATSAGERLEGIFRVSLTVDDQGDADIFNDVITFAPVNDGAFGFMTDETALFYLDPVPTTGDQPCTAADLATCVTEHTDGSLQWTFGQTGAGTPGAGGFTPGFLGGVGNDLAAIQGTVDTQAVATFTFTPEILRDNTGRNLSASTAGTLTFLGGNGDPSGNDTVMVSDFQFSLESSIPEPASLALMVTGLMGLGASRRRKAKA